MSLESQIESILFSVGRSVSSKELSKALEVDEEKIEEAIDKLNKKYDNAESGVYLATDGVSYKMTTKPENVLAIEKFIVTELSGDLSKPQLETLTIVGYLGPITKPELEEMRGVNCSIILKNLLMRGLVSEHESEDKYLPSYNISIEAMEHLGIKSAKDLPDYDNLRNHENIIKFLEQINKD